MDRPTDGGDVQSKKKPQNLSNHLVPKPKSLSTKASLPLRQWKLFGLSGGKNIQCSGVHCSCAEYSFYAAGLAGWEVMGPAHGRENVPGTLDDICRMADFFSPTAQRLDIVIESSEGLTPFSTMSIFAEQFRLPQRSFWCPGDELLMNLWAKIIWQLPFKVTRRCCTTLLHCIGENPPQNYLTIRNN